jgi:hypothetical protein
MDYDYYMYGFVKVLYGLLFLSDGQMMSVGRRVFDFWNTHLVKVFEKKFKFKESSILGI